MAVASPALRAPEAFRRLWQALGAPPSPPKPTHSDIPCSSSVGVLYLWAADTIRKGAPNGLEAALGACSCLPNFRHSAYDAFVRRRVRHPVPVICSACSQGPHTCRTDRDSRPCGRILREHRVRSPEVKVFELHKENTNTEFASCMPTGLMRVLCKLGLCSNYLTYELQRKKQSPKGRQF